MAIWSGVHDSIALLIAPNLEPNRRFCRPWTRELSGRFEPGLLRPVPAADPVTSMVRTVDQQARLQRSNRNAAPIDGDTASSHLAGLTVDIGKRPMSRASSTSDQPVCAETSAARTGRGRRGAPPGLFPHHGQQPLRRLSRGSRNSAPIVNVCRQSSNRHVPTLILPVSFLFRESVITPLPRYIRNILRGG